MAPQFTQPPERVALAVLVTQHGKHELRRERAAEQVGDVAQQVETMRFDQASCRMGQTVTANWNGRPLVIDEIPQRNARTQKHTHTHTCEYVAQHTCWCM